MKAKLKLKKTSSPISDQHHQTTVFTYDTTVPFTSQLKTLVLLIMAANTFASREAAMNQIVIVLLTTSWTAMKRTVQVSFYFLLQP